MTSLYLVPSLGQTEMCPDVHLPMVAIRLVGLFDKIVLSYENVETKDDLIANENREDEIFETADNLSSVRLPIKMCISLKNVNIYLFP